MTPEQVFSIANPVAMIGWLLLIALPRQRRVVTAISNLAVPLLLAAVYAALIAAQWSARDPQAGFSSLSAVSLLFANRWLLLAGWVHYLAFDLLVGCWELRDAQERGVPHWLVVPCLLLTFMFGPAGWLLYQGVRRLDAVRRT